MPNTTTNLSMYKPLVNDVTDQDLWGGYLNTNMDTIDSEFATKTIDQVFADKILSRAKLKDTGEIFTTPSISGNAVTLDYTNGNHFKVTLNANLTTITISNCAPSGSLTYIILRLDQDGTGSRTVTFPAAIKWVESPTVTSTASRSDIFSLMSWDAGTTFLGTVVAQNIASLG